MDWKRFLALTLVLLFLGMALSSASATASFVNATVNSTATLPGDLSLGKPGDEVQPQVAPVLIFVGMILLDLLLSWALERYVSPEAAMVYDAVSLLIPDPGDGLKLGIKVLAKHGDEITKYSIVIVKKDWWRTKVVKTITDVSASSARWVKSALGEKYIKEIAEKYVVKKGKNFDDVVRILQRLRNQGISERALKELVEEGADLNKILRDISRVRDKTINVGRYKVVIQKGNENKGIIHAYLRHVIGWRSRKTYTSMFPSTFTAGDIARIAEDAAKAHPEEFSKVGYDGKVRIKYYVKGIGEVLVVYYKSGDGFYFLTMFPVR
ncbi:hypothetical protein [Thermococcus thioreducens]|uniref:Bacterial EndoU nuclease domain-containing protein n=1 Tax=Thermococcus thioreducens TaxID=277988 RepID=A0A0Q2RDC9_9EURY|nr:hypothetical protein [Thermococcus thioreducens]ASJ11760.1 hypothetical protein A3L14_02135 [Thermococcus thioreducens]KQH81950.1 hypothetical protein AMR53_08400 [Thermococcus thioreducens]SEW14347.1 hypothetical protein SAMN05216170_1853 [Thermococcus thioreducens]